MGATTHTDKQTEYELNEYLELGEKGGIVNAASYSRYLLLALLGLALLLPLTTTHNSTSTGEDTDAEAVN